MRERTCFGHNACKEYLANRAVKWTGLTQELEGSTPPMSSTLLGDGKESEAWMIFSNLKLGTGEGSQGCFLTLHYVLELQNKTLLLGERAFDIVRGKVHISVSHLFGIEAFNALVMSQHIFIIVRFSFLDGTSIILELYLFISLCNKIYFEPSDIV